MGACLTVRGRPDLGLSVGMPFYSGLLAGWGGRPGGACEGGVVHSLLHTRWVVRGSSICTGADRAAPPLLLPDPPGARKSVGRVTLFAWKNFSGFHRIFAKKIGHQTATPR